MPNHVTNVIKLNGDRKRIRELLEQIQNDELGLGTTDFNKIIPIPENIDDKWYVAGQPMAMRKTVITQMPKNCAF